MFRFLIAAAAIALSTAPSLANGHGGGDAPPPPKPATSPAKVILTKQGPTLVDLNGMTLYYYERDTTGKTSNCNGKCVESWVPLSATADAKAIGDFTVISRNDGSKMWAYTAIVRSTPRRPTRRRARPTAMPRRCNGALPVPRTRATSPAPAGPRLDLRVLAGRQHHDH
jgi:predicted lipoprotein with Yx(FWY)xxD motif